MSDVNFIIDEDRRFSNRFDLSETLAGFVNNREFGAGYQDIESGQNQRQDKAYVWRAISAIGDDVANTLYENVLNYIDNISNVDLCKTKALQSLVNAHGIRYSILNSLDVVPLELRNLMDVYSINKKYLVQNGILDGYRQYEIRQRLVDEQTGLEGLGEVFADVGKISADVRNRIRNDVDEKEFYNFLSSTYFDVMYDAVATQFVPDEVQTSNADAKRPIWLRYSDEFQNLTPYETQLSAAEFRQFKLLNGIDPDFDEVAVVDRINAGQDTLSNYQGDTLKLLEMEMKIRRTAFDPAVPESKYMIQKKNKVKEYFDFIEWRYKCINSVQEIGGIYDIDKSYIELRSPVDMASYNLISSDPGNPDVMGIDESKIKLVADNLAGITIYISKIREYLKYQAQKNYMKGTYNLLKFVIGMFLKQFSESNFFNIMKEEAEPASSQIQALQARISTITTDDIDVVEYADQTEYFNISALEGDGTDVNERYWERESENGCFTDDEISNFYSNTLGCWDRVRDVPDFLNAVFQAGASKSSLSNGNIRVDPGVDQQVSAANYQIMLQYNGNRFGYAPYANHKNLVHPSYQLHPYLRGFIKYENIKNAVQNAFTNSSNDRLEDEMVKASISAYVGEFGQPVNMALNNAFDYSGYTTRYEYSDHYHDTMSSEVVAYDGAFYPPALSSFRKDREEFIWQVSAGYVGSESESTYFEKYYSHLGMSERGYGRVAVQLSAYAGLIDEITETKDSLSNVYDIFKYGMDRFENLYILYKKYDRPNPTYRERLDTPGQLWIRMNDSPIAFPAFYGSTPNVDVGDDVLNGNIRLLAAGKDMVSDPSRMSYVYDFEFDAQRRTLMLAVNQENNIDDGFQGLSSFHDGDEIRTGLYRRFQHADVLICNVEEKYDSFEGYTKLFLKSDQALNVGRLPNYSVKDFTCADKVGWTSAPNGTLYKDAPCLLGFSCGDQFIDAVYVDKRMSKDASGSVSYDIGQNGFGFNLKVYRYRYQTSGKMYGGTPLYYESALQEYDVQKSITRAFTPCGPDMEMSPGDETKFSLAFRSKPVGGNISGQTYIGMADGNGMADLEPTSGLSENAAESNSFDLLSEYPTTLDIWTQFDNAGKESSFFAEKLDVYNVFADPSYIPQYPGPDGSHDMSKSQDYAGRPWYGLQLLGESKNIDGVVDGINLSAEFDDDLDGLSAYRYGRVWEDYFDNPDVSKLLRTFRYSILNGDKWKIPVTWYTGSALDQLKIVVMNIQTCSKNPYFVGPLSALAGGYSSVEAGTYLNDVEREEVQTNDENVEFAGTNSVFEREQIRQSDNAMQGVDDVRLAWDGKDLTVEFTHSGRWLVRDQEVAVVIYNEYDIKRFELYHVMDSAGLLGENGEYGTDGGSGRLSDIDLSEYQSLQDVPVLSGVKGLSFKYSEEDFFSPGHFLFYYPGVNVKFPAKESDFLSYKFESGGRYSDLLRIFGSSNLFRFKLNDDEIADRIGNVRIPIEYDDVESLRVFEDYLSSEDDGYPNSEKYDPADVRILRFTKLFEQENSKIQQVDADLGLFESSGPAYLSAYIGEMEYLSKLSAQTVEQSSRTEDSDSYAFAASLSGMPGFEKLLNIYVNFKKDDGGITLYFNYQNYIDPPFVKFKGSKYTFDVIPGTYLKLAPGEDGVLDLIIQAKYRFDRRLIYGFRNVHIASFRIYNVSDDMPKFLVYRMNELQNDNSVVYEQTKPVEIMPNSQTILFEDIEETAPGSHVRISVDVSVLAGSTISALEYDILYSPDDLSCLDSAEDDMPGSVHLTGTDSRMLLFQTTHTYSELTAANQMSEYWIEAANAEAVDRYGNDVECVEDTALITLKYSTYIRRESDDAEDVVDLENGKGSMLVETSI